jgi:gamma-glutamyl:cysteine ligase YbdK (ATP-grasp superfamily)
MGHELDVERFSEADYARFAGRLRACLDALDVMLARPGFGEGPMSVGAELEFFLVDGRGRPLPLNREVLARAPDPRLSPEIDRFNVECNAHPVPLAGRPFSALEGEIATARANLRSAAAIHGGRPVTIGILPTLRSDDLRADRLTSLPRYRALAAGIRRLKNGPFEVRIDGDDPLAATFDDVALEGANTSFQIHLRVPPANYAAFYNAAQMAIAPVLALAGNSPLFLGHRLWRETRIALFKQSSDPRPVGQDGAARGPERLPSRISFGRGWVRRGISELLRETVMLHPPILAQVGVEEPMEAVQAGGVARLDELRLHSGTVYTWTRPVYDPAGGGHLRIEMRALPAGPSTEDMLADAALLLGLTLALAPHAEQLLPALPFSYAEANFYRAAQHGLDATLFWPAATPPSPRAWPARALITALLPAARDALVGAGVDDREADRLLAIITERTNVAQTGAAWQRKLLTRLEADVGRKRALELLLERYIELQETGAPVHTWGI